MIRFALIVLFIFDISSAFQLRFGSRHEDFRIVFQLNQESEFDILQIGNNIIVKIDELFEKTKLNVPSFISKIEIYQTENKKKTIVYIQTVSNVPIKSFTLSNPKRLVIDIKNSYQSSLTAVNRQKQSEIQVKEEKKSYNNIDNADLSKILSSIEQGRQENMDIDINYYKNHKGKKKIIVIDPGHGEHDPGATAYGLKEKDINLKVAKMLKSYFDKDPRFIAYLTRDDDRFIPLYERSLIALGKNADLFISIHTNASENPSLHGTYIYTLNLKGATSMIAKTVEERENKIVLNVTKMNTNPNVNKILEDIAISYTMTEGLNFAKFVEVNFKNMVKDIEFKRIESANFAVLKTPSIPAILFETAFITNERDAQLLKDDRFLDKIAKTLYKSTSDYFFKHKNLVFKEEK